jgi:tRNA pseudouridine38-40 synthase
MRNICLTISYDGTNYNGFQSQPNGNTIQDKLQEAIGRVTGERVETAGSGRTDAGVHARRQTVNFLTTGNVPVHRWPLAVNPWLPADIVVLDAQEMPLTFHAWKSVKRKTYRYSIYCSRYPNVFYRHMHKHHYRQLNVDEMAKALACLVGTHDFTSFCSRKTTKATRTRTIYDAHIEIIRDPESGQPNSTILHIFITGNGFLYNMVRIIVGTLITIGEGRKSSEEMQHILAACDRSEAGPTAVPHGLMLWDVIY